MNNISRLSSACFRYCLSKCLIVAAIFTMIGTSASAQTFEYPSTVHMDSLSLKSIVAATGSSISVVDAQHDQFVGMYHPTDGNGFTIKSLVALSELKVNVQASNVGEKKKFSYMILYKTTGYNSYTAGDTVASSTLDTLSISYDGDSLQLINDRSFKIAGPYHRLKIYIDKVFEITGSGANLTYTQLGAQHAASVPSFVYVFSKIYRQKYMTMSNLDISNYVGIIDSIAYNGKVHVKWNGLASKTPAGYEVEWTYAAPDSIPTFNFRNNASRIFTNNTNFSIPVAQKEGYIVCRVRMVRPDLNDLQSRTYGPWTEPTESGLVLGLSGGFVQIPRSVSDSLNWDLKMNFVEDGKYKEVITYYDGLLKPKQVQTRFNSNPDQTVVAQTLYDYEGRAVINSLPIPVENTSRFDYVENFLRPSGANEYGKIKYDSLLDLSVCPPKEKPIAPLDPNAPSNQYYSRNNPDKSGKSAYIPDAEGYPLVRKLYAAENNEKVLFEGMAGSTLQYGNDNHTEYLYGTPLQAELNRYFGQDIGKYNYYRKMITTDVHNQDMFSITDKEGRLVASGMIGSVDTTSYAFDIYNAPTDDSFRSNLLPVPDIRMDEHWRSNGSYFVETDLNYEFAYHIDYKPYKPCTNIPVGLLPKVYYSYEVIDPCGIVKLEVDSTIGGVGTTTEAQLSRSQVDASVFLEKGNHTWNKYSYIKMSDVRASVDAYLDSGYSCFRTFHDFLKDEFIEAEFPCDNNNDPCSAMKYKMMREMYPRAKYGHYVYTDSASKEFVSEGTNSIFSKTMDMYLYQIPCLKDSIYFEDTMIDLRQVPPQALIELFNDSIAEAMLPLHPDYCKLELCEIINDPYVKLLGTIKTAYEANQINRYSISDIASNDPLVSNNILLSSDLLTTADNRDIDSMAFIKTVCGSESGVIESACSEINASPRDITQYPDYIQDAYYRKLIELYDASREERLGIYLNEFSDTCGPCGSYRLTDTNPGPTISSADDTTFMSGNVDGVTDSLNMSTNTSFGTFFSNPNSITESDINNLENADNSVYCTELIDYIDSTLITCNITPAKLAELSDTLKSRFCENNNSITTLTYDSLTHIFDELSIDTSDMCNAGLIDLRRITRMSGDYVQLGLLHYSPDYYTDFRDFLEGNHILDSLASGANPQTVQLKLCDSYPFQQRLAGQLGISPNSSCTTTVAINVIKNTITTANAVEIIFDYNGEDVSYYAYPSIRGDINALDTNFGSTLVSNTGNYELRSLYNLYGFDKVSNTLANRNTVSLYFDGTKDNVQQRFAYFLSGFNQDEQDDYNLMEKDEEEILNGISCKEFIPMAEAAINMAEQLDIKFGHPYFETYVTHVINYQNSVNFDYENYATAMQSCGLSDSMVIAKHYTHFKVKFPGTVSSTDIEDYVDTLNDYNSKGIGVRDVKAYEIQGDNYLLLNIYEKDGLTVKDTRQVVESLAPTGSVIEYMPAYEKDTIAQLLTFNFRPIDPLALGNAFPNAIIDPGMPPVHITLFIPGYGNFVLQGEMLTIIDTNTMSDYEYSHYVDSVYKYVNSITPITTILTHAESGVSAQYDDWQMTAWRDYVMGLTAGDHNQIVKDSKPDKFKALSANNGTDYFSSSEFAYRSSRNPYFRNNLYIDHAPNNNSNYSYIRNLLFALDNASANGGTNRILTEAGEHVSTNPNPIYGLNASGTETRAYVCGDTTHFWVNHFDANNEMINIFIQLPEYLPLTKGAYELKDVKKGIEKDSVTYLDLMLVGYGMSYNDTIHCLGFTNKNLGETYTIPGSFLTSHSNFETLRRRFENCETEKIDELYPIAWIKYNYYRDTVRTRLISEFRQHIIDSLQEQLTIKGNDIKHGLTLYYYDMAGNLIRTVPPAGVAKLQVGLPNVNDNINAARNSLYGGGGGSTTIGGGYYPPHTKTTTYTYNAQNKVVTTQTPDAGTTTNYYDLAGRLMMSQDAKQTNSGHCTYFLYDNLSRVIETGWVQKNGNWDKEFFREPDNNAVFASDVKASYRREVTVTMYDTPSYDITVGAFTKLPKQLNLKNRVACTKYFEVAKNALNASKDTNYINAVHYSYDVSGNVKTMIHDLRYLSSDQIRFKRVDYEYDLYSGKVLMVAYNRGYADQFYQKYEYDSDNRITVVYTSNNGIFWDRDAHYEYYDHGPLARTEIGEQRVQGVDYAYTINGWLKAINGIENDPDADMGIDGDVGLVTPRDVFSQRVDYFNNDYKAIEDSNFFEYLPATEKDLYNGNIAGIATALAPFDNLHKKYHYDPLHRIARADYAEYDVDFTSNPPSVLNNTATAEYATKYKYDPDGNLLELKRDGGDVSAAMNGGTAISAHNMDSMLYTYYPGVNKLKNVTEYSQSTAYKIDVDYKNPPDPSTTQFTYDLNGQMLSDQVSGVTTQWNHYGKLKEVYKQADGTRMYFTYDPMGNRMTKEVVKNPTADSAVKTKTIYVRDATGNVLAIYEDEKRYDVERITMAAIDNGPISCDPAEVIPITFAEATAELLHAAYLNDPNDNLAKIAMTIPSLSNYADDVTLLEGLVTSLTHDEALDFVKSLTSITEHTLGISEGSDPVHPGKLSEYLQGIMLSDNMDNYLTDVFVAIKDNDQMLYDKTVLDVPATDTEKDNFPTDPAMLNAYKGMTQGERLNITDMLAQDLTGAYIGTFPYVATVLLDAFSTNNTYANFISEIPGGDLILDEVRNDAVNYINYRYAMADLGELDPDTVKAEFKNNGVLADVISQQDPDPEPEALAVVLYDNFNAVVSLAKTSGNSNLLVATLRDVVGTHADLEPAKPDIWFKDKEILKEHRQSLGEHHIYGSSRLGIQKYLPDEVKYHHAIGATGTSTISNLAGTKPWYSLLGNDLFLPTVYHDSMTSQTITTNGMGIMNHVLGNRHYELTNHLGNVQATILDRATPEYDTQDTTLVSGYKADMSTARDYYPFGMLMPGRYISDTAKKCVTINATVLIPVYARKYLVWHVGPDNHHTGNGPGTYTPVYQIPRATTFTAEKLHVYHYNALSTHPNNEVVSVTESGEGHAEFNINLDGEPVGGVSAYLQLHMDTSQQDQELGFEIDLPPDVYAEARVRQYYDTTDEYYESVPWTTFNFSGQQSMVVPVDAQATNNGAKTLFELRLGSTNGTANHPAGTGVVMRNYYLYISHYNTESRITTICDEKDNYRYAFNDMEKDNEPKGLGNSYDYKFRIYDPRLGRFLSVDPLDGTYAYLSSYQFAGNNPVKFIDRDGLEPAESPGAWNLTSKPQNYYGGSCQMYTIKATDVKTEKIKEFYIFQRELPKMIGHEYLYYTGSGGANGWAVFRNDQVNNESRRRATDQTLKAFQIWFSTSLTLPFGGAGVGVGLSTRLASSGADLGGQLLTNGGSLRKVNVTSVVTSGILLNPVSSEMLGQGFSYSIDEGFGGSYVLGNQSSEDLMKNVSISAAVGYGLNGLKAQVSTAGGTQSVAESQKDMIAIFGEKGAKTISSTAEATAETGASTVENIMQEGATEQ